MDQLIEELQGFHKLACRLILSKRNETWLASNILVDVNRPDTIIPDWTCEYADVAFVHATISIEELSSWLTELKGEAQGISFTLLQPQANLSRERYSTVLAINHFYHLPYPFTLYTVHSGTSDDGHRADPFTPLAREGLPSFPNYQTAVYRFFLNRDYQPGKGLPQSLVVIRVAHPEAWIENIKTEANAVEILLGGKECVGTQLTIGTPEGVAVNQKIDETLTHRFEVKNANSDHLWVVLSRGNRWLDWRDVRGTIPIPNWDVSGVQPENLAAHIHHLLLQGENESLEYKSRIPDHQDKFLKTVAAFANGKGGIILIGVADNGKVVGVKEDLRKFMDGIVDSIRNRLTSDPVVRLGSCEVDDRHIVAVFVREGEESPYGLNTKPPSFFVRRHGTTFQATPSEIRALGAKNQPVNRSPYDLGG